MLANLLAVGRESPENVENFRFLIFLVVRSRASAWHPTGACILEEVLAILQQVVVILEEVPGILQEVILAF